MRIRVRQAVSRQLETVLRNSHEPICSQSLGIPRKCNRNRASRIESFRRHIPSSLRQNPGSAIPINGSTDPVVDAHMTWESNHQILLTIAHLKSLIQSEFRRLESLKSLIAKHTQMNIPQTKEQLHTLDNEASEASRKKEVNGSEENLGTPSSGITYANASNKRSPIQSNRTEHGVSERGWKQRRMIQLRNQTEYFRMVSRNKIPKSS